MATKASTGRVRLLYKFIELHKHHYPVQVMREVLKVAPSGYCQWRHRPLSDRAMEDARLLRLIRKSFVASHGIYGAPRVFQDLREAGETCSKHRVGRLMRENNLRATHGYRTRRISAGQIPAPLPNLLERRFTVNRSNKAWVTDITYIRTWQRWLYLAVVMDLFSRKIVGWATSATPHRELILDAVLKAVRKRKPRDAVIHSDQGTQGESDGWK
jgi:putative transposase